VITQAKRDGPIHRLKIGAASDADRPNRDAAAGQQLRGQSIVLDGDPLAPIGLRCPPTVKAFSDLAIVPGPPISTQSTPRPSVNSIAANRPDDLNAVLQALRISRPVLISSFTC